MYRPNVDNVLTMKRGENGTSQWRGFSSVFGVTFVIEHDMAWRPLTVQNRGVWSHDSIYAVELNRRSIVLVSVHDWPNIARLYAQIDARACTFCLKPTSIYTRMLIIFNTANINARKDISQLKSVDVLSSCQVDSRDPNNLDINCQVDSREPNNLLHILMLS